MAKIKVSILYPTKGRVDELGDYVPIYNREIESTLLVQYVRSGFVVVDAKTLEQYVYDSAKDDVKKAGVSTTTPTGTGGTGTTGTASPAAPAPTGPSPTGSGGS